VLSDSEKALQGIVSAILESSVHALVSRITNTDVKRIGIVQNILSDSDSSLQQLRNEIRLGDPETMIQALTVRLMDERKSLTAIFSELSESKKLISELVSVISDTDSLSHAIIAEMKDDYPEKRIHALLSELQDSVVSYPEYATYEIYIDSKPCKSRIASCSIEQSLDSCHSQISVTSSDRNLYYDTDPDNPNLKLTPRIEVHIPDIGGSIRFMQFLIEERTEGDEISFTLSGRSLSAIEEYQPETAFSLSVPASAKSTAESLLTANVLDWEIDDWVLKEFEFTGNPIDGLQRIAEAAGAVLMADDDNTIILRKRYKVRPIGLPESQADVSYDRQTLTSISSQKSYGTLENSVNIQGYASEIDLPEYEIEESSPEHGQPVHVRVFWAGRKPEKTLFAEFKEIPDPIVSDSVVSVYEGFIASPTDPVATFATSGKVKDLGEYTVKYGIETDNGKPVGYSEYVFQEGNCDVEKPITEILWIKPIGGVGLDCEWTGEPDYDYTYEKYGKTIRLLNCQWMAARILYTSTYQRYVISQHSVPLLLVLLQIERDDIDVTVRIGDGDKPAPGISDNLITDTNIAVARGTAYLDANRYDRRLHTVSAAYHPLCRPGKVAFVNDSEIAISGNCYINKVTTVFDGPAVMQNMEIEQCQV